MFRLSNVRFRDILDIPELTIPADRVTAILGKSGSGKTTLLRLLNRLSCPTSGRITWRDRPIGNIDPVQLRRQVVMLPQSPVMIDGTIADNVNLGREFSQRGPIEPQALTDLLAVVHLDKPLDDPVSRLSGGEQQRVALARVLAMQPDALLLDEPSSALDEGTERAVLNAVMARARRDGITVVMVTHARDMANTFGDVIVTLDAGTISSVHEGAAR